MNKLKCNLSLINSVTSPAATPSEKKWFMLIPSKNNWLFYLKIHHSLTNLTNSCLCPLKMSAKPSDFSVISYKNRSLEFRTIFKCLVSLRADANASNILSNIGNFWCWKKCKMHLRACKIYKKEKKKTKIALHDIRLCLISIKLFVQYFLVHPTRFSCGMHLCIVSSNIWFSVIALSAKHMWWRVFQTFLLTFKYQWPVACNKKPKEEKVTKKTGEMEQKWRVRKKRIQMQKMIGSTMRFSCLCRDIQIGKIGKIQRSERFTCR